jgi:hypothetical protein
MLPDAGVVVPRACRRGAERTGQSTGELVRQAGVIYLAFLAAVRVSNEQQDLRMLLDDLPRQAAARDD